MATQVPSKYALKTLHEEIALFDRKLAHLDKYETFPSERERLAAHAKMSVKRAQLVRAAQVMTDAGIEFEFPVAPVVQRNSENMTVSALAEVSPMSDQGHEVLVAQSSEGHMAPPAGSILDFRNSIAEYKKRRKLMA